MKGGRVEIPGRFLCGELLRNRFIGSDPAGVDDVGERYRITPLPGIGDHHDQAQTGQELCAAHALDQSTLHSAVLLLINRAVLRCRLWTAVRVNEVLLAPAIVGDRPRCAVGRFTEPDSLKRNGLEAEFMGR